MGLEPAMMAPVLRPLTVLTGFLFLGCAPASPAFTTSPQRVAVEVGEAPSSGPTDAKVVFVEFADFQCPYCGDVAPTVKSLRAAYQDRVRFVFKQFPLSLRHPYAELAAEASLAANAQGKFWDYHDLLFSHQANLARTDLDAYAQQLGLDLDAFKTALDGHTFAAAVDADVSQGQALGVPATPSFFINGRLGVGALPYETLSAVIDEELSR